MHSIVSLVIGTLAVSFTFPVVADRKSDRVVEKLAGVWDVNEGVNQGEKLSNRELEGTIMKIEKNLIITYDKDEQEQYRSTFTIDASTKPISIDMLTMMKGVPPAKSLGILKFESEGEFKICYALPGSERPRKFESPGDSKIMLFECEKTD